MSRFLTILAITGLSSQIPALTWEECIKEAKKNHPDLISAEEKLNQAKAGKIITAGGLLPQISSSLNAKTSKTSTEDETDTYSYSITGKQLLFDGARTSHNVRAALENIKAAQYDYEVISSNTRLNLRIAFAALLRARELLGITGDISKRREQNVELVKLRYEAGREHKGSLLTARANLAQALFEIAQAKRNIDLAQRRLTKELGWTKLTPVKVNPVRKELSNGVKGDFEIRYPNRKKPDFESLAEKNPFLQKLIARKEAARFNLKSAKADFFPRVYADTSAGRTASDWPPDKDQWSVGVSLSLPLFEGGSRRAEVSRTKAVLSQAQADEESNRSSVALTLEDTWIEFQNMIDRVEVQKKFLEAAEVRAKIAEAQYSTGLISFDNWTIIEDNLVRTKKSLLDTQADVLMAEANWIQARGGTLDCEYKE